MSDPKWLGDLYVENPRWLRIGAIALLVLFVLAIIGLIVWWSGHLPPITVPLKAREWRS